MDETHFSNHTVYIDNRKSIVFTGITDVYGFDEQNVNLKSPLGTIAVKGTDLQISKLSLETGDVTIDGNISALQYSGKSESKGVFSKIFR